ANGSGFKTAAVFISNINDHQSHNFATEAAFGASLRCYNFQKYFTQLKDNEKPQLSNLTFCLESHDQAEKDFMPLKTISESVHLTRDLLTEPANVLTPDAYTKFCQDKLAPLNVRIEVLREDELTKLGMNCLLGVGQGSRQESQVVVMQWLGATDKTAQPVAFVGKGVCFDSGGISLKPANRMEEMKYDMGGSATVVGLMHAIAQNKLPINAIGVIGLVENMPDGNAQRPGDVVTSMSGKTVEVLNTDAEGRLVLADALWYTQDRFKPKYMINLATLTGAIVVALGSTMAGLFCNDDELANNIAKAGKDVKELVWRLPIDHADFKEALKSKIADIKHISDGYGASSITAAVFLKEFVNNVPWAHLDIAGVAWNKKVKDVCPIGATGWGVRLLYQVVTTDN
ncbi:MAG: leucyl aminopeptidase, partial [Pseudomonadota bacterium]